jgi:hypothetical protein
MEFCYSQGRVQRIGRRRHSRGRGSECGQVSDASSSKF